MIAREAVGMVAAFGCPAEAFVGGDVEKRMPPDIFWRMPVLAFITTPGEIPTDIMRPQSCFVPAERPEPHRVTDDRQVACNPHHFLSHLPGARDVLGHVGGIDDVDAVPEARTAVSKVIPAAVISETSGSKPI